VIDQRGLVDSVPLANATARVCEKNSCGAANPGRSRLSGGFEPAKSRLRAGLPAPLNGRQPILSQTRDRAVLSNLRHGLLGPQLAAIFIGVELALGGGNQPI